MKDAKIFWNYFSTKKILFILSRIKNFSSNCNHLYVFSDINLFHSNAFGFNLEQFTKDLPKKLDQRK